MSIIIKFVDESIYKDIEDLNSSYDINKKLEEINQEMDVLIVEKLVNQLKTMKPRNDIEDLKYLSDILNIFKQT